MKSMLTVLVIKIMVMMTVKFAPDKKAPRKAQKKAVPGRGQSVDRDEKRTEDERFGPAKVPRREERRAKAGAGTRPPREAVARTSERKAGVAERMARVAATVRGAARERRPAAPGGGGPSSLSLPTGSPSRPKDSTRAASKARSSTMAQSSPKPSKTKPNERPPKAPSKTGKTATKPSPAKSSVNRGAAKEERALAPESRRTGSKQADQAAALRSLERIQKLNASLDGGTREVHGRRKKAAKGDEKEAPPSSEDGAEPGRRQEASRRADRSPSRRREETEWSHPADLGGPGSGDSHPSSLETTPASGSGGAEAREDEYEDDFESYESDFEECTESGVSEGEDHDPSGSSSEDYSESDEPSEAQDKPPVEEERKLDSGNYDLATQKQRRQLNEIRDAILRENSAIDDSSPPVPCEVERNGTAGGPTAAGSGTILINFADAKQRQKKQKINRAVQQRGGRLLEMISLDMVTFSLLDMPSVPYEIYIRCYGKSNTQQMQTQTNEERLSEEVQTEEVCSSDKWTQHPVAFRPPDPTSHPQALLDNFAKDRCGVGGAGPEDFTEEDWQSNVRVNSLRLHNFLSSAAEAVLVLLEEQNEVQKWNDRSALSKNPKSLGFSEGHTALNIEGVSFLKGRPVTHARFSLTSCNQIMTVHKADGNQEPRSLKEECLGRCTICVWNIYERSSPQKILVSPDRVVSAQLQAHLVYAGLADGSVCVWDLREKSAWHRRTGLRGLEWTLRSPTFIAAKVLSEPAHESPVVSVECLDSPAKDEQLENQPPAQIATLEEDGIVIIWTVVHLASPVASEDSLASRDQSTPGLAPWGRVRLIPSASVNVRCILSSVHESERVECKVMAAAGDGHLYVGTNAGLVAHSLLLTDTTRARPPLYLAGADETAAIECIEPSPFGHPIFLVGCSGGRVRLYKRRGQWPLLELAGTVSSPGPSVRALQWSANRPGLFFVLDDNSSIHVWDLCTSDIFPRFTVPVKDTAVTTVQLSPHSEMSLLAVATDSGAVEIHKLIEELSRKDKKLDETKEMDIFMHYISIL